MTDWSQHPKLWSTGPPGLVIPGIPKSSTPLDYGYLAGTSGGAGNEIDVWRGSLSDGRLDAVICTVGLQKRDAEIKLLLGCTQAEEDTILGFDSEGDMAATLIRRGE